MFRCGCWCLGIYLTTLAAGIAADGKLSIKLVNFENRKSMLLDGSCCDGIDSSKLCSLCEYSFAICASGGGFKPCSICNYRTYDYSSTEIVTFGNRIDITWPSYRDLNNPLQFTIGSWNGTLSIGITAYDEDDGGLSTDVVAIMVQNITINATKYGVTETEQVVLEGKERKGVIPKLTLTISVECKQNYLIPTCEEYCIDTDDATGHYKCNYDTGIRECLPGWYGVKCTCTPRNDTNGHYSCDSMTGEKICLPGWKNVTTNCTQTITRKTPPLPSTTEIILQPSRSSMIRIDASTNQYSSLSTPGTAVYSFKSSGPHSNLFSKVTYLSTSTLPTEVTYPSTNTLPIKVTYPSTNTLPTKVTYPSTNTLPTKVTYHSSSSLPTKVTYPSTNTLPTKVTYHSSSSLPTEVTYPSSSTLATEVTCLSTSTLPPKVTILSSFQQPPASADIKATSQHASQGHSHSNSTVNPILQSSFITTPSVTNIATSNIETVSHSSQLSQQRIPCSLIESKSSISSAATMAFESIPNGSTESRVKRTKKVLLSESTVRAEVQFSKRTMLVQNTKTVSLEAISKSSTNTRSPTSSMKNVIPTKNPLTRSTQPTKQTAKPTEKRKSHFDVSKLMAIGLSALALIILFVTVIALNKRKNRVQLIEPMRIAGRYKKSSAGFTASTSPSMSSASTSVPSIGSILEKRVGQGSYVMQEYPSKPPSAASGSTERSMNSPLYIKKLSASQWSTYSGTRSQSSSSMETSGQYPRGGYKLLKDSVQVESAFVSNERCNEAVSSHPFIIQPKARNQKISL